MAQASKHGALAGAERSPTLFVPPMRLLLEALLAVAAAHAPGVADRPGLSPVGGVPM